MGITGDIVKVSELEDSSVKKIQTKAQKQMKSNKRV